MFFEVLISIKLFITFAAQKISFFMNFHVTLKVVFKHKCSTPFLHLMAEILLGAKLMEDFLLFSSFDGGNSDGRTKLMED